MQKSLKNLILLAKISDYVWKSPLKLKERNLATNAFHQWKGPELVGKKM